MGAESKIQWTHHTFNPWEGCFKITQGCDHCYAEARNKRFHHDESRARLVSEATGKRLRVAEHWGQDAPRLQRSEAYWKEPRKWAAEARRAGERRRVFCASLADVFEARDDLDPLRARLFRLIEETPELDWLLLTKRPEMMRAKVPAGWARGWPSHVWAGATVEDNDQTKRAECLLEVPAAVRFVSVEPMLNKPDLRRFLRGYCVCCGRPRPRRYERVYTRCSWCGWQEVSDVPRLDWIILGGESGSEARPFDMVGAAILMAEAIGTPIFVKQFGACPIDGNKRRLVLKHPKGGDPDEWPEPFRVRQFPGGARAKEGEE